MAASEEAYGEGHLATFDKYDDENGKRVERKQRVRKVIGELSGEAYPWLERAEPRYENVLESKPLPKEENFSVRDT